jgi:hypothetical protein
VTMCVEVVVLGDVTSWGIILYKGNKIDGLTYTRLLFQKENGSINFSAP